MKNYYDILGIPQTATKEEIHKAYRKLALKFHPDGNQNDKYFEEMFKQINEANEILTNDLKRANYDFRLKEQNEKVKNYDSLKFQYENSYQEPKENIRPQHQHSPKRTAEYPDFEEKEPVVMPRSRNDFNQLRRILWSVLVVLTIVLIFAKTDIEKKNINPPKRSGIVKQSTKKSLHIVHKKFKNKNQESFDLDIKPRELEQIKSSNTDRGAGDIKGKSSTEADSTL
jgi:curved DNA-binding protein CbpA